MINIFDQLDKFLEYNDLNDRQFSLKSGLSNGILGKARVRGALSQDNIAKILHSFPELNANWLFTGNGEMLQNSTSNSSIIATSEKITHNLIEGNLLSSTGSVKDLGLPKVVTVREHNTEAISLVPVKAAAGYLNGYSDPEYIENLPTINVPNLGSGSHRAFEIKGHSMNPTLHSSSVGIGRWVEHLDDIRDRRIYIVVTKTEGVVTKRVLNRVDDTGRLVLISDNSNKREYPNILLDPSDILEIWYLRAVIAFEFPEPDIMYQRVNDLEAKFTVLEDKINRMSK